MKSRKLLVLLTIALQTQSYAVQLPSSCKTPYSLAEGEAHLRRAADRLAWVIHHKAEVQTALLRGDFEHSVDSEKVTTLLKKCAEDIASGARKCALTGVALPNRDWRTMKDGDVASPVNLFLSTSILLPLTLATGYATMAFTQTLGWESFLTGMAIPGTLTGGIALCEDLRLKAFEKKQAKHLKKIYEKNFYDRLQELGITVPSQRREEWLKAQLASLQEMPVQAFEGRQGIEEEIRHFQNWLDREIEHQRELRHHGTADLLAELRTKIPTSKKWNFWQSPHALKKQLEQAMALRQKVLTLEKKVGLTAKGVNLIDLVASQADTEDLHALERRQKIWAKLLPKEHPAKVYLETQVLAPEAEQKLAKLADQGWKLKTKTDLSASSPTGKRVVDMQLDFYSPHASESAIHIPVEFSTTEMKKAEAIRTDFHKVVEEVSALLEEKLPYVAAAQDFKVLPLKTSAGAEEPLKLNLKSTRSNCLQLYLTNTIKRQMR